MSIATRFGTLAYLVLALVTLFPFAIGVVGVWAPSLNWPAPAVVQAICAYSILVLGFMGGVRWGVAVARPGGLNVPTLLLGLTPPVAAFWANLLVPSIGARWSLALVVAAFAIQGAWDLNSSDLPEVMKRARPIVTIGALAALLVALLGS